MGAGTEVASTRKGTRSSGEAEAGKWAPRRSELPGSEDYSGPSRVRIRSADEASTEEQLDSFGPAGSCEEEPLGEIAVQRPQHRELPARLDACRDDSNAETVRELDELRHSTTTFVLLHFGNE
jgi:hypothetical protein